jgi:hypothetical protein
MPEVPPVVPPPTVGTGCNPPALLVLADIPDDPSLDDGDLETVAIFEVNEHQLVGKFVRDASAAESGLKLWQELTLRIPSNQLRDLVQFEISTDTDPVAYFNRNGDVNTKRFGLKIGFSTANFERNDPDPCARLQPRRGTFDWSLIHEFGHLRGWLDRSWDHFLETFPDGGGDGSGYPEDGSPTLEKDWVTSYAERADGDEDYAESWTTFVMLGDDAIPAERTGEPLAPTKVRWVAGQPGLAELRKAIRITEPDGGNVTVAPAPRLSERRPLDELAVPSWLQGTWRGVVGEGTSGYEQQFTFVADDVVESRIVDGAESGRRSLRSLEEEGVLIRFEVNLRSDMGFGYNGTIFPDYDHPLEDSFYLDSVDGRPRLYWTRLGGPSDAVLHPVE